MRHSITTEKRTIKVIQALGLCFSIVGRITLSWLKGEVSLQGTYSPFFLYFKKHTNLQYNIKLS